MQTEASDPPPTSELAAPPRRVVELFRRFWRKNTQDAEPKQRAREALRPADTLAQRPPGWRRYWSARYGALLARTLNLSPPIIQNQDALLAMIPRPLNEALDPIASLAEPMHRDGKLARWRLRRSVLWDLFGPVGLLFGTFVLASLGFIMTVSFLYLPPLMAPQAPPSTPQGAATTAPGAR